MKKKRNLILNIVFGVIFSGTVIFGILSFFTHWVVPSQATLVLIEGFLTCIGLFVPFLLERFLGIRTSFTIRLGFFLFLFCASTLGEACQFYYRIGWWDDLLHAFSGLGITLMAYCITKQAIKHSGLKHQMAIALFVGITVSFSVAMMWELIECMCDTVAGTNMQKFIPETSELFNGGNSWEPLNGTDEQIAAFYRSPEGYKYALMDTMTDIIDCAIGTACFVLATVVAENKKENAFDKMIVFTRFEDDLDESVSEEQTEELV